MDEVVSLPIREADVNERFCRKHVNLVPKPLIGPDPGVVRTVSRTR